MIGLPFSTSCSDEGPGEVGADDSEQSSDEATPGVTVPLSDKFIDMVVVEGSKISSLCPGLHTAYTEEVRATCFDSFRARLIQYMVTLRACTDNLLIVQWMSLLPPMSFFAFPTPLLMTMGHGCLFTLFCKLDTGFTKRRFGLRSL